MHDHTITASVIQSVCELSSYAIRMLLSDPALSNSYTKCYGRLGGNGVHLWAVRTVLPVLRKQPFFNEKMERELVLYDHLTREIFKMSSEKTAYTVREGLSAAELERLERDVVPEFRIAVAEIYGGRLHESMVEALARSLSDDPTVYHYLVSSGTLELDPKDREQMRELTRRIVENDELAQRNLAASDDIRRRELEAEFLASLKPGEALKLDRANLLSDRIAAYVEERLDARYAVCTK